MRFFILSLLFLSTVFAVERPKLEDFVACFNKNKASVFVYEGMNAFALSENLLAVVKAPNSKLNKYVKYDPFLNLYLVRTEFSLIPTNMFDEQNLTRNDWIGIIDPTNAYIGHLKYLAQNITERDRLDFATKVGQLSTPCCNMLGIALADGSFIGNRYLKHFMKYNDVYWGDIGVDFTVRNNKIYVENVRSSGQFLVNDEIVSVDDIPADDIRKLNEKILFADRDSTLYFRILRDNVDTNISVRVSPKEFPNFDMIGNEKVKTPTVNTTVNKQPNHYRSNLGFSLNNNLVVSKVEPYSKAAQSGLMVGDRILRINNQIVRDSNSVQKILISGNEFNLLISRSSKNLPTVKSSASSAGDGQFQFFIRLNK